ncbi:neuropeptide FF receptor 2-like [Branchiostoma floridae]|uniref:Neuropeptide FF receptor 2-like n=2 Tax=Branchiostoma floridae TaxID=7739 RepID=A0A9J7LY81_BRAFL|nr:neuropeptide FF receptor 2-like [Branchiostoma floridae]
MNETSPVNESGMEPWFTFPEHKLSPEAIAIYSVCYTLVFLGSVVGNLLVVVVIGRTRRMWGVTNFFIFNLAVSDLLIAVFCMPFTLVNHIFIENMVGDFMCRVQRLAQGLSVASSVFTLTAIAVDRHRVILHPEKTRMSNRQAIMVIVGSWTAAAIIMIPQLVVCYEKEEKIAEVTFLICGEFWPSKSSQKGYTAALFVLCYLAPLLIITVLYYKIAMRVWFKPRPGESNGSNRSTSSRQACLGSVTERRGRVVRMVITMVMVFALTWLPLYICWLVEDFGSLSQMQIYSLHHYGYPIVHLIAFSNSCIDPLVYGIFTANFRQIFNRGGRGARGGAGNIRATHPTGPDFAISPPSQGSNFRWNLFAGNARHVGSTPSNKPSTGGYSTARTSPDFNAATSFSLFTMNPSPLSAKNNDIDLDVFLPRVETAESVSNLV